MQFLFYLGISHTLLGNHEAAIADYDRVIALDPTHIKSYLNRGAEKSDLGRYEAAITDYTQAIALKPDYVLAYYNRGVAKGNLGRYDAAIADYDHAIAITRRLWTSRKSSVSTRNGERPIVIAVLPVASLVRQHKPRQIVIRHRPYQSLSLPVFKHR